MTAPWQGLIAIVLAGSLTPQAFGQAEAPEPLPVPANQVSWYAMTLGPFAGLGIGNRTAYAEVQATPAKRPVVGLGVGAVHAWKGDLGVAGFQATAWVGFMLVVYGRIEAYRDAHGLGTAGVMLKLPIQYTGGF